jgi:hypothetical protein
MARILHKDQILYLVSWDGPGIIKIGFADDLRRRLKEFPGARLVLALAFPTLTAGLDFETGVHRIARETWPWAFTSRADARPRIARGVGFRECYLAPPAEALDLIASQCAVTMQESQCDVTNAASRCFVTMDERTDGLTETSGFRDGKIFRCVTRRRAGRIFGSAAMAGPDICLLARTAYETGISPVDYATENVIEAHVSAWLDWPRGSAAVLSRRILGDLMDAGWTPPEVTR